MLDDEDNILGGSDPKAKLYSKLQDKNMQWQPLESLFYKSTHLGECDLRKQCKQFMTDEPDLKVMKVAMARYGGPVACMVDTTQQFIGKMKEIAGVLFLFDSFGRSLNTLRLCDLDRSFLPTTKVVGLHFTTEEDVLVLTAEGDFYLIDPCTADFKEPKQSLGLDFQRDKIVSSKVLDNLLYFKTQAHQFSWVSDITQSSQIKKFASIADLGQASLVSDYLLIPKEQAGSSCMELLVAHPESGFYHIREGKHSGQGAITHAQDLQPFGTSANATYKAFGKVEKFALNAKKEMLTLYSEPETLGRIIVMKADLTKELGRQDTRVVNAEQCAWCGNDMSVLTLEKNQSVQMIGPVKRAAFKLEVPNPAGIGSTVLGDQKLTSDVQVWTELDGLRVMTLDHMFFVERVSDSTHKTFKIASISPAAKLLYALKADDEGNPQADEIIRSLKEKIVEGIAQLQEAAAQEHDVTVLKHLLRAAMFAKKFVEPSDFDSNAYVDFVNKMIVVTKIRNSKFCARAITAKQIEKLKPKNMLALLLKHRDYFLAEKMVEVLNLRKLTSQIYEDWTGTMIKVSKLSEQELIGRMQKKFNRLAQKLVAFQNIRINEQDIKAQNVRLNIDFTKLARMAQQCQKTHIADFLITFEQSITKKIPFLLEIEKLQQALEFSMQGGDPNIINKVMAEILRRKTQEEAISIITNCQDQVSGEKGGVYLRNYAAKRKDVGLLNSLAEAQRGSNSYFEAKMGVQMAYTKASMQERAQTLNEAGVRLLPLEKASKDDFFSKALAEMNVAFNKQALHAKKDRNPQALDQPLRHLYLENVRLGVDSEIKNLQKHLKLSDKQHFALLIAAQAEQGQFDYILKNYLQVKKAIVPPRYIAEICLKHKQKDLATKFALRIQDYDDKIPFLIDLEKWEEAVNEIVSGKKFDYLEEVQKKGPRGFGLNVDDIIAKVEQERGVKLL